MNFSLTPEQEKYRREISDFLDKEVTYELTRQSAMDKGVGPEARAFGLKIGTKGWLGKNWPEQYGGSKGTLMDEYVLVTEFARHEVQIPNAIARFLAGPNLLRHGSEELKQEFLPRIIKGEIEFGLSYSEPQAGSDLMMMEMRASDAGDHFIINGQKTFNTEAHYADYHWLAAKTDFDAPRHRSLSLFIVDQFCPGITVRPMWTLGGERTNEVFYDNVKVPKSRLVGEKNKGFLYMVNALNYERLMMGQVTRLDPIFNRLVCYTKETRRNGNLLSANPLVRNRLSQLAIQLQAAHIMEDKAWAMLIDGREPDYEAGLAKLLNTELQQQMARVGIEIIGFPGHLEEESKGVPLRGEIARLYRAAVAQTIGGGTSEIIRNTAAIRGLGLPH